MVRLLTDTSANLPRHLLDKHGITMLAFQYNVNGVPAEYKNDWDAEAKAFFDAMRAGAVVDTSLVKHQRILLLDDIITTGATASEAARTLLIAGAKEVKLATVAVAHHDK